MIRPFLKWAGGKSALLPEILKRVPQRFDTYYEPFLGAGAVFFALSPRRAVLSDTNLHLMDAWAAVQRHPKAVLRLLDDFRRSHDTLGDEFYYHVRALFNERRYASRAEKGAMLIYLNKACFNGLWRVNRAGRFNVPVGRHKNLGLPDEKAILECAKALRGATLWGMDFRHIEARTGDFIYCDPPYAPSSQTAYFTAYTAEGFDSRAQEALAEKARQWRDNGACVLLSNANHPRIRELYRGFKIDTVTARRSINSNGARRGAVEEVLISS